ncbi:hypothetical protein QQZ08_011645 [Neonectria magnoliae]|uniref:Uncharacterized protein n=1 Tax=Neonectria magnoliae TaxID=2732573 RepID=A0ABR1H925_9HYPO
MASSARNTELPHKINYDQFPFDRLLPGNMEPAKGKAKVALLDKSSSLYRERSKKAIIALEEELQYLLSKRKEAQTEYWRIKEELEQIRWNLAYLVRCGSNHETVKLEEGQYKAIQDHFHQLEKKQAHAWQTVGHYSRRVKSKERVIQAALRDMMRGRDRMIFSQMRSDWIKDHCRMMLQVTFEDSSDCCSDCCCSTTSSEESDDETSSDRSGTTLFDETEQHGTDTD